MAGFFESFTAERKSSVVKRKSLIVNGPLLDLGDVLAIARVQGKIVLGVERVRVLPFLVSFEDGYVVVVEESK